MENKFSVLEDGIEKEYKIVKLCKNNNINYIIYSDGKNYYGSRYELTNKKLVLDEIINDEEWDFIDKCLGEIDE